MIDRDLTAEDIDSPVVYAGTVLPEWIDVNHHMNVAYYILAFDHAIDAFWHTFGLTDERRNASGSSTFAVEAHVRYLNELREGEGFSVAAQILAFDTKRLHHYQYLFSADSGRLAATCEWLHLHVDLAARRVTPWPEDLLAAIRNHPGGASRDPWPAAAGQRIEVRDPLGPALAIANRTP